MGTESLSTTLSSTIRDLPVGRHVVPYKKEHCGVTGRVTWHVQVVEVFADGSKRTGPPVLFGVDMQTLRDKHDGKHANFLTDFVKPYMLKQDEDLQHGNEEAETLIGKVIA